MTHRDPGEEPAWVRQVRTSAEIAVVLGGGVLAILDALERHRQLELLDAEPEPPTTPTPEEN